MLLPPPRYLALVLTALTLPATAYAGDCCSGCGSEPQVPGLWVENCANICQDNDTSSDIGWECDTTRNGDGSIVRAVVIFDDSGSVCGKDYCAWGQAADGNAFYCSIDGDEGGETLTDVTLLGGSEQDELFFTYDDGTVYKNLDTYLTNHKVTARMVGRGDIDYTIGSYADHDHYSERLFGGAGGDIMCGNDGDDFMNGNVGEDLVCGDAGNDTLLGDANDDVLCGGDDDDDLSGGAHSDHLDYEAGSSDTNDGGLGYDYCNNGTTDTFCEDTLASSPASCP